MDYLVQLTHTSKDTHIHNSWIYNPFAHARPHTSHRVGYQSHSGTTGVAQVAAAALSFLFVLPLYTNILRVERTDYSKEGLSSAIDQALGPLALLLGLMGFSLG